MDEDAQNGTDGDRPGDHWSRLDAFLATDARDAGCDRAREMLDVYAELLAAGADPGMRFPELRPHFLACGSCAGDLAGLLHAITDGPAAPGSS